MMAMNDELNKELSVKVEMSTEFLGENDETKMFDWMCHITVTHPSGHAAKMSTEYHMGYAHYAIEINGWRTQASQAGQGVR